jgi:DNA-binding NtrC family response regulator
MSPEQESNHGRCRLFDFESGPKRVLLVDADEAFGDVLQGVLGDSYDLMQAPSVAEGSTRLENQDVNIVLLNLDLPDDARALEELRSLVWLASDRSAEIPVIAYSWDKRQQKAVQAFHEGVFDFIEQPLDIQALKFALDRAWRRAMMGRELAEARRILHAGHVEGLLGNSKAMEQVNEIIRKVSGVFTSVLITGESGTGKGVVAQAIHRLSPRAKKPFIAFSASSFPETLMEDELFGHERGAFTGALQSRRGRFEEANGGTIFLDEIGDLPLHLQTKLLRVLQERIVERLGSNVSHPIDVRLICATNRNLEKMVREGTFREDLFFRISVVKIEMPPLRQRGEDIPLLAEYFLRMFAKTHNKPARGFTPGYLSALSRHSWPGNVRELQNVIERSLVLADGNEHLGVRDLPMELGTFVAPECDVPANSFHEAVQSFKRELIRSALRMHSGNKLKAARELGISRCYLHRLLNQFKMNGLDAMPEFVDEVETELEDETVSPAEEMGVSSRIV